ncbi:MAG: aminotransferase class V-fold PLP-dependent enzyme [Ignavibacteria bacterium]|nr:aminotransferase class V-fold PLP-dependent enzyme [Ignavibacteria bacterium]
MHLQTLLSGHIHNPELPDPFGATHFPIYQSATFDLKKQESDSPFDYSRTSNPTRAALENILAVAEQGCGAVCTNTGLSAIALVLESIIASGDSILTDFDLYGGSNRLLGVLSSRYNVSIIRADLSDAEKVQSILRDKKISIVLCESPTNPGLKIIDIQALASLCHQYGTLLAVDNSLATFASQKPLNLGADFSILSTTKYVSGHGATVAGAAIAKLPKHLEALRFYANAQGRTQAPMEAFLVSLGLPTLELRMKAQEASASQIADFLATLPAVHNLRFPFSNLHPQSALAKRQMKICPSVITFELESAEKAGNFVSRTKLFGEKVSFGNADSRIEQPSKLSHASMNKEQLSQAGISQATIRLAIGLEHPDDLQEDIANALK